MNVNVMVGTRVYHQSLGEGMINKVKRDVFEVLFLNGNKQTFSIDGNEVEILSDFLTSKPKSQNIPVPIKEEKPSVKVKKEEKVIEKPVDIPEPTNKVVTETIVLNENEISVGSRVNHKEFGEGMVNKITSNQYEVLFMDGKRIKFEKNDSYLTAFKKEIKSAVKHTPEKKETGNFKMSFKQKAIHIVKENIPAPEVPVIKEEIIEPIINETVKEEKEFESGARVYHQALGEGMINKITDKFYEVVFLDGKKSRFVKTDSNLTLVIPETNILAEPKQPEAATPVKEIKVEKKKEETQTVAISIKTEKLKAKKSTPETTTIKVPAYISTGSRIYHKVKGEGMIAKIKDDEYEIIFMDGSKAFFFANDTNLSLLGSEDLSPATTKTKPATTTNDEPKYQEENIKQSTINPDVLSLGNRWKGGTLILKPINVSLQKKEYTIESFFHIILSIYKRVASLEEIINTNNSLSQNEKQEIQMQIKAINRSLVAFNMLFKEKEDYFSAKD